MSRDVDYRIISLNSEAVPQDEMIATVRKLIRQTGTELGLSPDWMNDGVKGFVSTKEEYSEGLAFGRHIVPALEIVFPSSEYLLAMKCVAMRNTSESPHDRNDILKLAEMAGIADAEAVLDLVQRFYPLGRLASRVEFGVRELLDRAAPEEGMEVENDADVPGI